MSKLTIIQMSPAKGDEPFSYDLADPLGATEAEAKFREIMGLGHAAVATKPETGEKRIIRSLSELGAGEDEIVFRPPYQGG